MCVYQSSWYVEFAVSESCKISELAQVQLDSSYN